MNSKLPQKKFGLLTAISMIVGIVIGSGIFFRTNAIMERVNGNLWAGIAVFIVAAIGIIFGGLTISQYAQKDDTIGGSISYCEKALGNTMAFVMGWFQTLFYYPALAAVVTWVAANYTCALFGLPSVLVSGEFTYHVWVVTIIYIGFFFPLNLFSTKEAGKFQSFATISKTTSLFVLAAIGLIFGNPQEVMLSANNYHTTMSGFIGAIVVVAFAFDGWIVAPSIAHEIKNPKRNLPIALTIAPLLITAAYLIYFVGVVSYVTPDKILAGADSVATLASSLGPLGMKIILILIIISVLGTSNGLILGFIRLPYALAVRNSLPFSKHLEKIHPQFDIPLISGIVALALTLFWLGLHFLSTNGVVNYGWTLFEGLEVDNLPIVLMYIFYILLYVGVMKSFKELNLFKRFVIPVLAILGASIIVYGGLIQDKFNVYLIICLIGIGAGLLIKPKNMLK